MRRVTRVVLLSLVVPAALSVGCDREPSKSAAPAAPAAQKAPDAPGGNAAGVKALGREPDTHPEVAAELLKAAGEFSAVLAGIHSDADATGAEPKLRELAEHHEALAARAKSLPPPTAETDKAIRADVQKPLQEHGRSVRDHIERLKPADSVAKVVMPHVDRIGRAAQAVAVTSHVDGRTADGFDGSPEEVRHMAAQAEAHKDVAVPTMLHGTPTATRYATNAAPLVREHGAARVAVVMFNQVSTTDRAFLPLIAAAAKSLKLESSLPTLAGGGRTMNDVFVAMAPVDDLADLAARLKDAIPDARTSVNAAERMVSVSTESSTVAQQKRAARLQELGAAPAKP